MVLFVAKYYYIDKNASPDKIHYSSCRQQAVTASADYQFRLAAQPQPHTCCFSIAKVPDDDKIFGLNHER